MSVSKNAPIQVQLKATLISYLKRFINGLSKSSLMLQQIKMTTTISSLVFLFMISGIAHLSAQEVGDKASIKTKAGNTIYGTLITKNDSIVAIETSELGLVSLARNKIKKMRPAIFRFDGSYWFENPNPSRNLFTPTGIGLRKGEGNYQNTMLIFQTINYGLTDHFSIGGGFEIASLILGDGFQPVFILTSKISTANNKGVNTAAGVIAAANDDFSGAILYSATTIGDRDNNFTAAVGFVRQDGGWVKEPVISISAMGRVSKKFSLITENWILTKQGRNDDEISFLISAGGRYIAPSISVDFALILSHNFDGVRLPWLGITIPFGK